MSEPGAYEDGMGFLRNISEGDVERLLAGNAPATADHRLEEVAGFVRALAVAVPEPAGPPNPALIARLAEGASASAVGAASRTASRPTRHRRSRAGLIARIGIAAAAVPVLFAGLAVAGVTLPGPAQDAFDRVGIELPNQAGGDDSDDAAGSGDEGGAAGPAGDEKGSKGKGEDNRRSRRRAYGPSRSARPNPPGEAVRRGPNPTPGTPPGKPETSPSAGSNAGGNAGGSADANGKALGLSK